MLTPQKDTVVIRGSIEFDDDDAELPLESLDITVSVDVGPIGKEDPGTTGYSGIPRFNSDETTPVTVIDVDSLQTTLVAPYALSNGVFDTGFAISNMNTVDEQSGTIMFMLYQTGEDMVPYETEALDAGGTVAVLLSDILTEAGVDMFQGYVKIVTNFTGADGIAYISDWAAFSATATLEVE